MRRAEVTKSKAAKKSFFNISTAPIAVMKAQREVKKDPKHALEMIEKVLEDEPYNRQANMVLKEAAVAAAGRKSASSPCRRCSKRIRATSKFCTSSAGFITRLDESDKEVEVYNRISEIDPLDAGGIALRQRCFGARFHEDRRLDARRKVIAI